MTEDRTLLLNSLRENPWATALELFNFVKVKIETRDDKRFVKASFPEEDQSIRVLLAKMRKEGLVISRDRPKTVLMEWSAV